MMGRLQLLTVLALLALCAASGAGATGLRAWLKLGGGDEPSPSANCLDYQSEDGCLEQATCSWCTNAVLGTEGCVPQKVASLVPAALAECTDASNPDDDDDDDDDDDERLRAGKHSHDDDDDDKPKPPTSCGDNKEKHDCLHLGAEEGDCAWCAGDFMPASCVGVKAAEWIPEQVAKCRMPKKKHDKDGELTKGKHSHDDDDDDDDDKPKPKPPTSCGDNKEKHDCLHLGAEEGDCAWCAGDFMPASCVGVKAAEWIPEQVAKCRMPKKKHDKDGELTKGKHSHDDDDDDDDDKPKPKPPTSCGDNKEKHDCLHLGAEEGDCAWCAGDFMPASCVGVKAAEWIPEQVAKCRMPKKKHDKDGELTKGKHSHDDDDDDDDDKPKPKPPTSCGDNKEKHDCLHLGAEEGDCAWCAGDFMPASCVGVKAAEWIPEQVAKCRMPKKKHDKDGELTKGKHSHDDDDDDKPKPPTSCGDNKEKHDCLHLGAEEGDCAWCAGDFMPASCVGVKAAEWIPEQVAKCRMPKKKHDKDGELTKGKHSHDDDDDDDDKPKPKPPTSCGDNKEKHDCLHLGAEEGDCAWCAGDFMPASCVGIKAAEWIPEQVAKCRMPKKHRDDDDDAAVAVLSRKHKHKRHDDDDDDSGSGGGGFIPGGGGWPGSSGGYPGSSGGYPGSSGGGSAGGGGQGCMALKTKKKCLKGTDTEACAWCGSASFLGSPCVSESTAKYLPKMVADCKMGKGPKKGADAAVATS